MEYPMSSGTVLPMGFETLLDSNGAPVAGGLIYTYLAGTVTPQATYTDGALLVPNTNPVVTDSAGRWTWFGTPGASYKFLYQTPAGATIRTADNIATVPLSAANLDIVGTAGEALTAGLVVYLSDGSGSKVAGLWYKADNTNGYSSALAIAVGMVPAAIASGASGTIRLAGQVPSLTVAAGTRYFVGVAGALTATAPANLRVVGGADSATSIVLSANPGFPVQDNAVNDFRLTLTTAVPVTPTDVTAATTLYWTPYTGNRITLYDSAGNPTVSVSLQLSIAVPATTATVYDVFVFNNAGVPALELLAWTNDTTRATAIVIGTATGAWCKSGDLTRRYVGSVRTTGVSGQTEDSAAKRYCWNYYNRVRRPLRAIDATAAWTYSTATWRQANANTANQVDVVVGVAEALLDLRLVAVAANSNAAWVAGVAIGEDAVNAVMSGLTYAMGSGGAGGTANLSAVSLAFLTKYPAVGRHFYAWIEFSVTGATTTFQGTAPASIITSGLSGSIEG
jgi:hypothetical protein